MRDDDGNTQEQNRSEASASSFDEFRSNCKLYVTVLKTPTCDLIGTLENFQTWIQWIAQGNGSDQHAEYFYSTAIPEVGEALLERHLDPSHVDFVHAFHLQLLQVLCSRLKDFTITSAETSLLLNLLNPRNSFHTLYGHPLVTVSAIPSTEESGDQDTWLENLDKGQLALVYLVEEEKWQPCRAVQVSPTNTEVEVEILDVGTFKVEELSELEDMHDALPVLGSRWFAKEPGLFKPILAARRVERSPEETEKQREERERLELENKLVMDFDAVPVESVKWRLDLAPGDMCDARTNDGTWYQAVVLKVDQHVGEQVGNIAAHDELLMTFVGFSSSKDEKILRGAEMRLAPLNTASNGKRGPLHPHSADLSYSECVVDDREDPSDEDKGVFAVMRTNHVLSTSKYIVDKINVFALNKGYEALIERLRPGSFTVSLVRQVILLLSRAVPLYTRTFIERLANVFLPLFEDQLGKLDAAQVRLLDKGCVGDITEGIYRLSVRVYSRADAAEKMERFALLLARKRLESQAIIHRLDAMDYIMEWMERIQNKQKFPAEVKTRSRYSSSEYKPQRSASFDQIYGPSPQPGKIDVHSSKFSAISSSLEAKFAKQSSSNATTTSPSGFAEACPAPCPSPSHRSGEQSSGEGTQDAVAPQEYVRVPIARWMTFEYLAEWVVEQRIVDQAVIGPLSHHEMVKRSTKIVGLLASTRKLTEEMVDLVWDGIGAAYGSDEDMVNALYTLLGETAPAMGCGELSHLLCRIEDLPSEKYTLKTVQLLCEVSKCTQYEPNMPRPGARALLLLWKVVQDDAGVDGKVANAAQSSMEEISSYYSSMDMMRVFNSEGQATEPTVSRSSTDQNVLSQDQLTLMLGVLSIAQHAAKQVAFTDESGRLLRETLLQNCLENIQQSKSVLQALKTLQSVLNSFPTAATMGPRKEEYSRVGDHLRGCEAREEVLLWLESKHGILSVSLDEFAKFSSSWTQERISQQKQLLAWYTDQIFGRLEWISFVVSQSSLALDSDQVDMIWNALLAEGTPKPAKLACFRFLQHCVDTVPLATSLDNKSDPNVLISSSFSKETMEKVFVDKLCKEKGLNRAGFVCFQAFFIKVNVLHSNLAILPGQELSLETKKSDESASFLRTPATADTPLPLKGLQVIQLPLLGDNELWHLALESPESVVAQSAARMLSQVQLMFSEKLKPQIGSQRKAFIGTCLREMMEASSLARTSSSLREQGEKIRRCLGLLRPLLEATQVETSWVCTVLQERAWSQLEPHFAQNKGELYDVTLNINFKSSALHGEKIPVRLFANDPVWKFRSLVLQKLDLPPNSERLRLFAGGKEIKRDQGVVLLRDLTGFCSGITVIACEKPTAAARVEEETKVKDEDGLAKEEQKDLEKDHEENKERERAMETLRVLPGIILTSESSYVDQLFGMLEMCSQAKSEEEGDIADHISLDIWHLLERLPSDQILRKSLEEMSPSILEILTGGEETSPFKLLYCLELIEARITPIPKSVGFAADLRDFSSEFDPEWSSKFLAVDGFSLLQKALDRACSELIRTTETGDYKRFSTCKRLEIVQKLACLAFQGLSVCLFVKEKEQEDRQLENLVLSLMPHMQHLNKIQSEIDLSGGHVTNSLSMFPFLAALRSGTSLEQLLAPPDLTAGHAKLPSEVAALLDILRFKDFTKRFAALVEKDSAHLDGAQALLSVSSLLLKRYTLDTSAWQNVPTTWQNLARQSSLGVTAWGVALWVSSLVSCVLSAAPGEELNCLDSAFLSEMIGRGLVCTTGPSPYITRRVVHSGLFSLCQSLRPKHPKVVLTILHVLLEQPVPALEKDFDSADYFSLAEALIELGSIEEKEFTLSLLDSLYRSIQSTPAVEQGLDSPPVSTDWTLFGRLNVLRTILSRVSQSGSMEEVLSPQEGEKLLNLLLDDCLFGVSFRCHRNVTRAAAYSLVSVVLECCKEEESLWEKTTLCLQEHTFLAVERLGRYMLGKGEHSSGMAVEDAAWGIEVGGDLRAPSGFVGLINPGFICYMNSLVQQLYMQPRVRYGVLSARTEQLSSETKPDLVNLLVELQKMFAALDLTVKQAYNPSGWCMAFKDEAGQPVNIWQQQDAHEFFNSLCDRLDEILKTTSQGKVLTKALGVSIANQLVCIDDSESGTLKRENAAVTEYCLTQEIVSSSTNLHESLENFVTGEVLNDYKWEERDGKELRTLKRQCIAGCQDTLFIHLKRFRLNWETFMTEKINTRFEFPLELDLFPYTKEGLEWKESHGGQEETKYGEKGRDYYHFRLSGIVVHSGASLNSGHYYSYICSKLGVTKGQWYEFNDRMVRPFDISKLDEATFGGGVKQTSYGVEIPSVNNAYMVVYERVVPQDRDEDFLNPDLGKPQVIAQVSASLGAGETLDRVVQAALFPEDVFTALQEENSLLEALLYTYGQELQQFYKDVLNGLSRQLKAQGNLSKAQGEMLLTAASYTVNMLARGQRSADFGELVSLLCELYDVVPQELTRECLAMTVDHSTCDMLFTGVMFVQRSDYIRESFGKLFVKLLDRAGFAPTMSGEEEEWSRLDDLSQILCDPIKGSGIKLSWWLVRDYLGILSSAAINSGKLREVLVQEHVIVQLVASFLGKEAVGGVWDSVDFGKRPSSGIGVSGLDNGLEEGLCIIAKLVCSMWPFSVSQQSLTTTPETLLDKSFFVQPDPVTLKSVTVPLFYENALSVGSRFALVGRGAWFFESLGDIMCHLSFGWPEFSGHALQVLLKGLHGCNWKAIKIYFELLGRLLSLQDGLCKSRLELVFGDSTVAHSLCLLEILQSHSGEEDREVLYSAEFALRFMSLVLVNKELSDFVFGKKSTEFSEKWLPPLELVLKRLQMVVDSSQALELTSLKESEHQSAGQGGVAEDEQQLKQQQAALAEPVVIGDLTRNGVMELLNTVRARWNDVSELAVFLGSGKNGDVSNNASE